MTTITRPTQANETDLLIGLEFDTLKVVDLDGKFILQVSAPVDGWTHDILESTDERLVKLLKAIGHSAFDLHLGEEWVGSTEI